MEAALWTLLIILYVFLWIRQQIFKYKLLEMKKAEEYRTRKEVWAKFQTRKHPLVLVWETKTCDPVLWMWVPRLDGYDSYSHRYLSKAPYRFEAVQIPSGFDIVSRPPSKNQQELNALLEKKESYK
jgi:hypothetical protein